MRCHLSSLRKHHEHSHQLAKSSQPKIFAIKSTKKSLSAEEIEKRNDAAVRFCSSFNIGYTIFESDEMKNLVKTICEVSHGRDVTSEFAIPRNTLKRLMNKKKEELFSKLKLEGRKLAELGYISLKADHLYNKKFSSETTRDYFCVVVSLRIPQTEPVTVPIEFKPVTSKTHAAFLLDFRAALEVIIGSIWRENLF